MGRVSIYHRKHPGTNRPDAFIVKEYANGKYYHHRQFSTKEAAERYLETAIEKAPRKPKMLKDYPTAKQSLKNILKSNRYSFPKRVIR